MLSAIQLRESNRKLREEIADLKASNATLDRSNIEMRAEIERLRNDLVKISLAKAYSEERVVEQMAEIERLRGTAVHVNCREVDATVLELMRENERLCAAMNAEVEKLRRLNNVKDTEVERLRFVIRTHIATETRTQNDIERLRNEFKSIQQDWYAAFGARWPMRPFPAMSDQP